MDLPLAIVVVVGLPTIATVAGLVWRSQRGRVRRVGETSAGLIAIGDDAADGTRLGSHADLAAPIEASDTAATTLGVTAGDLGSAATLVQYTTEWCATCPAIARALRDTAETYDGVRHVELDLTHDLDLARRANVRATPTTLVLDDSGRMIARIVGPPRITEVRALLDDLTRRTRVAS